MKGSEVQASHHQHHFLWAEETYTCAVAGIFLFMSLVLETFSFPLMNLVKNK